MEFGKILESLWRLYSIEIGEFQVGRGCKSGHPLRSGTCTGGAGLASGGVRGVTPPQGTGLET